MQERIFDFSIDTAELAFVNQEHLLPSNDFPDFPIERWQVLDNVRDKPRDALHDHLLINANCYEDRTGEEPTIDMLVCWGFKWQMGALTQKLFPSFDIYSIEIFAACRNYLTKYSRHRAYWLSESYKDRQRSRQSASKQSEIARRHKSIVTMRQLGYTVKRIVSKIRTVGERQIKRDIAYLKEQGVDLTKTSIANVVSGVVHKVKSQGDISIHGHYVTAIKPSEPTAIELLEREIRDWNSRFEDVGAKLTPKHLHYSCVQCGIREQLVKSRLCLECSDGMLTLRLKPEPILMPKSPEWITAVYGS